MNCSNIVIQPITETQEKYPEATNTEQTTTLATPTHRIDQAPNQTLDTKTLKSWKCSKQDYSDLNFNEIQQKYGVCGVTTIKKLNKAIDELNTSLLNIHLVQDKQKSVFRISNSAKVKTSLIRGIITNNIYVKWYPHYSKNIDEDYEITLKCNKQNYKEQNPYEGASKILIKNPTASVSQKSYGIPVKLPQKTYIPGLPVGTRLPYPLNNNYEACCNFSEKIIPEYVTSYVNTTDDAIENTTPIGNQKFIPVNPYNKLTRISDKDQKIINDYKLEYIITFLKQNKHIKYLVDVGCGSAKVSLTMQKILKTAGLDVTVFPVDIDRVHDSTLPVNLLPAQQIKGADPSLTVFISTLPFLEPHELKDDESYYLLELIKNNPGCFVLITERYGYSSTPSCLIPAKFVYAKELYISPCNLHDQEPLKKIRNFFEEIPKNKSSYLTSIQRLKEKTQLSNSDLFDQYAHEKLKLEGVNYHEFTIQTAKDAHWWHVYQQTIQSV
jgi:hypothetical protein